MAIVELKNMRGVEPGALRCLHEFNRGLNRLRFVAGSPHRHFTFAFLDGNRKHAVALVTGEGEPFADIAAAHIRASAGVARKVRAQRRLVEAALRIERG